MKHFEPVLYENRTFVNIFKQENYIHFNLLVVSSAATIVTVCSWVVIEKKCMYNESTCWRKDWNTLSMYYTRESVLKIWKLLSVFYQHYLSILLYSVSIWEKLLLKYMALYYRVKRHSVLYKYYTSILQILYLYYTSILQVLYLYYTSILQVLYKHHFSILLFSVYIYGFIL